jgi:inhibitor of cysteine peptidase
MRLREQATMKAPEMLLLVGTLAIMAVGCGATSEPSQPTRVTLTNSDFGRTATVAVGESFTIALEENPTTGFSWRCSWEPTARLELTSDTYTPAPTPVPIVGSGGTRCFTFKALTAGDVTLTLQYGRWWEGGEKENPQTITIHVTG